MKKLLFRMKLFLFLLKPIKLFLNFLCLIVLKNKQMPKWFEKMLDNYVSFAIKICL